MVRTHLARQTCWARAAVAAGVCGVVGAPLGRAHSAPPVSHGLVYVPASDPQAGGPTHSFRISRFEVRNDEFVVFLNDVVDNPDTELGHFVYVDTTSGNVYVNTSTAGSGGSGPGGRTVIMFRPASAGQIEYADGTYRVVTAPTDFSDHPVTGITWYGAVKFCNWYTLQSGLHPDDRAYGEGSASDLAQWRPVTIAPADWAIRDLNSLERESLLQKLGYRLPSDGGRDGPSPYNEWLKAASARFDGASGSITFDALFGFGRDALTTADANHEASSDPFEPGTTPVGFYDSFNMLLDGTTTTDTDSAYGLYDVSGNAWEWMQDQVPTDPTRRRNRGGSWRNIPGLLRVDRSANRLAASEDDATGLRLVQSVVHPVIVTPHDGLVVGGIWGGPYDDPLSAERVYELTNVTDAAVEFLVDVDEPWIRAQPAKGTIGPGQRQLVTVSFVAACDTGLAAGTNESNVRFAVGGQPVAERPVSATLTEPLSVTPPTGLVSDMPFGTTPDPGGTSYVLQNASALAVDWTATWVDTSHPPTGLAWLQLNDANQADGSVPAHSSRAGYVDFVPAVAALLDPGAYTAKVTFTDACTGTAFLRDVSLTVMAPFSVTPDDTAELESVGVFGGPFEPGFFDWQIERLVDGPIVWTAKLCEEPPGDATCTSPTPSWLSLNPASGTIGINDPDTVTVTGSILPGAASWEPGTYSVTVRIAQEAPAYFVDRSVTLRIKGLEVAPTDETGITGPTGGPFAPAEVAFTLTNNTGAQMSWEAVATLTPSSEQLGGLNWLDVSPMFGAILDPGGQETLTASVTDDALELPPGRYEAEIVFTPNDAAPAATTRKIALRISGEAFSVPMVLVPAADVQSSGPTYDYRIGKFEVTNDEFARFLNDARRNLNNPRGQYLYFDTATGNVWVAPTAAEGTSPPSGPDTALMYNAALGRIFYDPNQGEPFVVDSGFADHPVVGVSFYGAAKFCNWLTVLQGMPPAERAYSEGPTVGGWRPLAFDPADPGTNLVGYRLPMDGGTATSGAFNEWYKAATRQGLDQNGNPVFGAVYGFGRSVLGRVDANYLDSGDTPTNATTPVGFFNGSNKLTDNTTTVDTHNGYGLYDLCGNAAEWVHDLDLAGATPSGATRGGHFQVAATLPMLRNDARVVRPAAGTFAFVGFRVAQSLMPTPLRTTLEDIDARATGPVGGPFTRETFAIQLANDAAYTLNDLSFSVSSAGAWLGFDGTPPRQLPPNSTTELLLLLGESAETTAVSPKPADDMVLVPAVELLPGGPAYGYWMASTEVTNAQFAAFLNDAHADAVQPRPGLRSAYMHFDDLLGDVYIAAQESGVVAHGPPDRPGPVLMFDASVGRIRLQNGTFAAQSGFENHPVVGVTWFGAVKYCNWLTVHRALPETQRAYTEGVSVDDWHPVTVSTEDWVVRGITGGERLSLGQHIAGYRLPMDGGNDASDTDEWRKAATARIDAEGEVAFDAVYGFGRDALTPADANYAASGDTEAEGTTTVGFFNGSRMLSDGETITAATDNRYGLVDLSGNVSEWMQDPVVVGETREHAVRGGSWRAPVDAALLRADGRLSRPSDTAADDLGFRVARTAGHVASVVIRDRIADIAHTHHVLLDVTEPLMLGPLLDVERSGPFCSDLDGLGGDTVYLLQNTSAKPMPIEVTAVPNWLTVTSPELPELAGDVPAGGSVTLAVATNEAANDLLPGMHEGVITITRMTDPQAMLTRKARLEVAPSAELDTAPSDATYSGFWEGPFDGPAAVDFTLRRCSTCDSCSLDYEVSASETWLTLSPAASLAGTLPPSAAPLVISAGIDETADTLLPGAYRATVQFTLVDPTHGALPDPLTASVKLDVHDPIVIEGPGDDWFIPCALDSAAGERVYTLTNHHSTDEISVTLDIDVPWIELDRAALSIPPGASEVVTFTLNEQALPTAGEFPATVTIHDLLTDYVQLRELTLRTDRTLCVTPLTDFDTWGRIGGVLAPAVARYTLTNLSGLGPADWTVSTDAAWILVNGQTRQAVPLSGTLSPGDSMPLAVSIDAAALPAPAPGVREEALEATLTIVDLSESLIPLTRTVRVHRVHSLFSIDEVVVPSSAAQPHGPVHAFHIGRHHTTNAEFVVFLNDAMAHPDSPRGAYMFFDTGTGNVYVNTSETGAVGADPGGRQGLMFAPAAGGQIEYADGAYRVVTSPVDYTRHPVSGVSWYGAVKYANWLTLDQGYAPAERCYAEGTDADLFQWRPGTIAAADWRAGDLTDRQRRQLINEYAGYRLPMDDGFNNVAGPVDEADEYNEWYKAAAWSKPPGADSFTNTLYGFGRNVLTAADANYRCSLDPFESPGDCTAGGSTPVGYYDGTTKDGGFVTEVNNNGFGLLDMTGNVNSWMQGKYAPTASPDRHTLRGGSWFDPVSSDGLKLTGRGQFTAATTASARIGIRVLRAVPLADGDIDSDGDVDLDDVARASACQFGPGDGLAAGCAGVDFDGDGDVDLADIAELVRAFNR